MGAVTSASRLISGQGTPFRTWQSTPEWIQVEQVDAAALIPARLVVVAPHPDDEILATGGLIRLVADAGRPVLIVAVTDGGASHPSSTRWPAGQLPAVRRTESERALARLETPDVRWLRLGIGDGTVAAAEEELAHRLPEIAGTGDVLVSPWDLDGHPDHEAVARATAAAAAHAGVTHLQAPIWGWHWARPEQFPWSRAVAVTLPPPVAAAKAQAVTAFVSQLERDRSTGAEPILPDWALARLVHDREVFLR